MTRKFTFLMTAMALILAIMGPRNVAWGQTTQTWSYEVIQDSPTLFTDSPATVNGATWSIVMGEAVGSPTTNGAPTKYSGTYGWKWGDSSSKYYKSYTLSTDYFTDKNVKSVTVNFLNNGKKTGTMTVTQGTTTIGTTSAEFGTTWTNLTANTTTGTGGTLSINYAVAQASYIHSITVEYEEGTTSTVAAPTFSPEAGTYYEDKTIELSAEEGCTIYYTLNGTTPTAESTEYSTPIQLAVPSTTTIKAIAVDGENNSSNVASATYILKRSQYTPAQLLAEVVPDNQSYTVVFTDEVIKSFYVYNNNNAGFYIETTEGDFLVYKSGTPSNWEVDGKVSGTVSGTWKTYSNLKEFCPTNYDDFTYTPPTQQLPTPTGLEVSNLSMTGATLSWNAVEHASSYTVYVTDANEYEETYTNITENSKVLDDLTAGTEYMWTVQAIGDGVTYLNSGIAEGEVFETPTTVLYTVNFDPQQTGGTIEIDPIQAAAGEEVIALATAANHFSFTQWNFSPAVTISEGEITDDAISFIMPASDVTVTATFTEEAKYTVTYAKGGDDVTGEIPTVASYYAGETVEVAENPFSYVGHTFNGWSFNPSVEIVTIDDVDYFEMPASNVTVTATWAEKTQYTVTYMSLGAQIGTEQVYEGDLCANVPTVSNIPTGWTFLGWTTGSADNTTTAPEPFDLTTPIISATTLNAVFTKTEGEASWDETALADLTSSDVFVMVGSNEKFLQNNSTTAVDADIEDEQVTTTIIDAYKWNVTEEDGSYVFNANGSTNVLYFTNTNNGVKFGTPQSGSESTKYFTQNNNGYLVGTDGTNTRYLSYYSTNNDWRCYKNLDNNPIAMKFYKLNAGTTYYTTVAPATEYAITIDENIQHGTVEVEGEITAAIAGTEITLIVTPAEHYSLTANSLTVTGASTATVEINPVPETVGEYTFVMPAEAVTITARFTENPKFTVSCYANGTLVSTEQVYAGVMQLPGSVTAPNGYTFVGWTNQQISGVAESASYFSSYNVTEDVDLYAVFAIATKGGNSYRLSSTAPVAGDNVIVAGKDGDKYYALSTELSATELTIANGVVTNYEACVWSASYGTQGDKSGIVLNNGTNPLHMNSSALKVASGNQNGTFEFPVSGDGFKIYGNQNTRWMTFNGNFGVTNDGSSASTLYFFMPVSSSNFCTTVNALSGNLAEATTEANTAYYISAAANVPANTTATINGVLGNADASLLVINDGGQLIHHNAGVAATFQKNITAYADAEGNDGYYLIANPTDNETVVNLVNAEGYDLYTFNGAAELEWINMKSSPVVANDGIGYLYANSANVTLGFAGEIIPASSTDINLNYANKEFGGFNLIGNPFACNAYVGKSFYVIDGSELVLSENNYVAPCEGFFVEATEANQSVTVSTAAPVTAPNALSLNVSQNRGNVIDRAIVRFDGANDLHKFMMNPAHTNLSIAKGGETFAAISTEAEGELPVNFKAEKNGTYTITVNTKNVDAEYLHLIDNMTGMDVDLLSTPSYTFEAKTSDYASRFKLVFGVNNTASESSDSNFAFMSDGNLVINNIEGEATLQIVDELGRVISTETVSGSYNKALNLKAGLYIINLNGMTQKIVVE